MNSISQLNMNTMSVPMQSVPNNYNSSLLGLNFGPSTIQPNPVVNISPQKNELLGGFNTNSNNNNFNSNNFNSNNFNPSPQK